MVTGSLVAAATFKFELSDKVKVGRTELKPGKYLLEVDGANDVPKDKAGKAIEARAKVEQPGQKAAVTFVGVGGDPGAKRLTSVVPAGSQVRVVFE